MVRRPTGRTVAAERVVLLQCGFKVILKRAQALHFLTRRGLFEVFCHKGLPAVPPDERREPLLGEHTRRADAAQSIVGALNERNKSFALEHNVPGTDGYRQDLDICSYKTLEDVLPNAHIL